MINQTMSILERDSNILRNLKEQSVYMKNFQDMSLSKFFHEIF